MAHLLPTTTSVLRKALLSTARATTSTLIIGEGSANRRSLASRRRSTLDYWSAYKESKKLINGRITSETVNERAVFANNELDLGQIETYGFDFDYTLAVYHDEVYHLIYGLAKANLVQKMKYPRAIDSYPYDSSFAVRGLHFDVGRGLLLKIDSFHNIQLGSVYRGLEPIKDDEVVRLYDGTHVSVDSMNQSYGHSIGPSMAHKIDLFSPPETMLLANTIEYLTTHAIPFDSEYIYSDVRAAIQEVHSSGTLHREIMADPGRYLRTDEQLAPFLNKLANAGKRLFLITNSSFDFVHAGLEFSIGSPDWQQLFDVVICEARKPKFFYKTNRAFRRLDQRSSALTWERVNSLEKGNVYVDGNISQFTSLTGWSGHRTIYFGDHVYIDLLDPTLKYGWRTGAIIPELEREIGIQSTAQYWRAVTWLTTLENLIGDLQEAEASAEQTRLLRQWSEERDSLRQSLKSLFNPHFGSLFRTHHNPTYFSRRLARFADIYTSKLTNLQDYSGDHTFFPYRAALPHEWQVQPLESPDDEASPTEAAAGGESPL